MADESEKKKKEHDAFLKADRRDSGFKKAAVLLILLGKEHASKVLSHLSEEEALGVAKEIARTETVNEKEAKKVLEEFGYLLKIKDLLARGGLEKAKEMLVTAFGEKKGGDFYARILEKTVPHPFSFLNDLPFEQVLTLLKNESTSVIPVILSHIDPSLSSRILGKLPPEKQKEIVVRIAKMEKIPPEVLRKTEEVLQEKARTIGDIVTQEVDGKAAITEILKHLDASKEKDILEELASSNPELAEDLEKRLFTTEVIYRISGKDLQKVLHTFEDKEIALLLKGKDTKFKDRIMQHVSSRRGELIKEEFAGIGRILKSEVDKMDTDFLNTIRDMANKKEIAIADGDDEYIE
ncbi:MAG: flagellar motor switch protein FliG [Spirochaetales bacterium]|nr:flagellar motor switch protein FliG [Spirochaetales bacterium]